MFPPSLFVPWTVCAFYTSSSPPSPLTSTSTTTTSTAPIDAAIDKHHEWNENSTDHKNKNESLNYDDGTNRKNNNDNNDDDDDDDDANLLCDLIESLGGSTPSSPDHPSVSLRTDPSNGVRGIYVNRPVSEGEVLFWIPLSSCLVDNNNNNNDDDRTDVDPDPSQPTVSIRGWVTRLAVSLLKLTTTDRTNTEEPNQQIAFTEWTDLLPTAAELQRCLPVHWDLDQLYRKLDYDQSNYEDYGAGMRTLLYAATAARSARLPSLSTLRSSVPDSTSEERERALDLVQTRSLSFHRGGSTTTTDTTIDVNDETGSSTTALHILAPVVDMINHSYLPNVEVGIVDPPSSLNEMEDNNGSDNIINNRPMVVVIAVRATEDLLPNTQLFIRYGPAVNDVKEDEDEFEDGNNNNNGILPLPAWKCLLCYGFVPQEIDETETAELVVDDGERFEVSAVDISENLIRWQQQMLEKEKGVSEEGVTTDHGNVPANFTENVGRAIIDRLERAALGIDTDGSVTTSVGNRTSVMDLESRYALMMLHRLRESRRGIFLDCAHGLREYLDDNE